MFPRCGEDTLILYVRQFIGMFAQFRNEHYGTIINGATSIFTSNLSLLTFHSANFSPQIFTPQT
jgi:hypothetical protein